MALIDTLGEIPDPRRGNAQRHELLDILAIALVASVCGAESCVDFAEFGEDRETLLREFLILKNGLPATTPSPGCSGCSTLPPSAVPSKPSSTTSAPPATGCSPLTARRYGAPSTAPPAARRCMSSPPSAPAPAWPSPRRRCPRAQNETLAARALLETLALDGLLVTGDAMHAHEGTAQVILDRGGDYLLALKANRPAMLREVEAFFADPPDLLDAFETTDADHGRIETRRHRVTHSIHWLFSDRRYSGEPRLPGLATLACVEATRTEAGRTSPPPATTSPPRPSPPSASPAPSAATGRSRTACTGCSTSPSTRTAPATAATTARRTSPSSAASPSTCSTRARPKMSVARKRKRSGWSDAFARTIIGQMR